MNGSSIPFLDLVTPHVELEQELTQVFQQAIRTASFIGGPAVENFERAFADFCDTKQSVAVNSGTDSAEATSRMGVPSISWRISTARCFSGRVAMARSTRARVRVAAR